MNRCHAYQTLLAISVILGGCAGKLVIDETHAGPSNEPGKKPVPDTTPVTARSCMPSVQVGKGPKVDLLFMIDNSSSMADKQEILALAIPDLVGRLVDPACVDSSTLRQVGSRNPDGSCTSGVPDFPPVNDIHIGIITSSLGGHGSSGVCDQPDSRKTFPHNDDRGHLVSRGPMDAAVTTIDNKPFLSWNPALGGAPTPDQIVMPFQQMVSGVGQHGCGYEASLESIYHFLIDPDPYDTIQVDKGAGNPLGVAVAAGTDVALLQQRAEFLRPDSLVAVVAVTDENDCSVIDGGQNFYALVPPSGSPARSMLTHGTSACKTNPNDPCCYSCLQMPPAGCPGPEVDSECADDSRWLKTEDPENLRCFHQKQRYGIDFLYPVQRYIDGFTKSTIIDRHGAEVKNPLYSDLTCRNNTGCAPERPSSLVFLSGIVGVPWQDIAVDQADLTQGFLSAKQIADQNVWARILGDPEPAGKAPPVSPTDTHMVESVSPREGLPGLGSALNADPVHGHEWDTSKDSPARRDLQYACIFHLMTPKTCADSTDCDCANPTGGTVGDMKNPLCQNPQTNAYSTQQSQAKAYPGIRELQVLRGLGGQGIIASICPANMSDPSRSDYGYRPAIAGLLQSVRDPLRNCF
jgi:hypothetical protein